MGREVYIPLGFQDEYEVQRYERKSEAEAGLTAKFTNFSDSQEVLSITAETMEELAIFECGLFWRFENACFV